MRNQPEWGGGWARKINWCFRLLKWHYTFFNHDHHTSDVKSMLHCFRELFYFSTGCILLLDFCYMRQMHNCGHRRHWRFASFRPTNLTSVLWGQITYLQNKLGLQSWYFVHYVLIPVQGFHNIVIIHQNTSLATSTLLKSKTQQYCFVWALYPH